MSKSLPGALVPNSNVAGLIPATPPHPAGRSLPSRSAGCREHPVCSCPAGYPTLPPSSTTSPRPPPSLSSLAPAPPVGSVHLAPGGVGGTLPSSPQTQESCKGQLYYGAKEFTQSSRADAQEALVSPERWMPMCPLKRCGKFRWRRWQLRVTNGPAEGGVEFTH